MLALCDERVVLMLLIKFALRLLIQQTKTNYVNLHSIRARSTYTVILEVDGIVKLCEPQHLHGLGFENPSGCSQSTCYLLFHRQFLL